jgi:predicted porin
MQKTYLMLAFLVSASAAFGQTSPKMSYDMVRVGYAQSDEIEGWGVSGSALLGDHVIVTGGYQDLSARNLDDVDGKSAGFGLGLRYGVGSGDIIVGASFAQLTGSGVDGGVAVAIGADVTSYGITYRHSFSQALEGFVSYSRVKLEYVAAGVDLDTGAAVAIGDSVSDDQFSVALRYNFNPNVDLTAGYTWVDGDGGWSVSLGYNF